MKSVVCLLMLAAASSCFKLFSKSDCKSGKPLMGYGNDLPSNFATAIQKNPKAKAMLENGMALVMEITEEGNTFYVADVGSPETDNRVHLKLSGDLGQVEELNDKKFEKYTRCKEA
ncbi:hypothetical protein Q1695_004213 [Nippostrongylus brasiliensis]|nr:hypothetical protein Q1695_004213 [Nippostrongylus brasiliensis]